MRPASEHRAAGNPRTLLAVSMGDPAGIGLDITLKAWAVRAQEGLAPFVLFADPDALAERARALHLTVPISVIETLTAAAETFNSALPVRAIPLPVRCRPGVPDPANASAVIGAIEQATAVVAAGEASALVTNPIAKHVVMGADFPFPGHTEFLGVLAERHWSGRRYTAVMMLAARNGFRVVPFTVHCRLADVPGMITREGICETVRITHAALKRDFRVNGPRIAVTGLNPHAGEEGSMGREEIDVIAPAITDLRAEGLNVTGPYPADTLFHEAARATYDAAVCMYHDQALIPFKTIAFEDGVNVTLGLPFVRTSPDHGTAFELAGKGGASAKSLVESLKLAAEIASARAAATA